MFKSILRLARFLTIFFVLSEIGLATGASAENPSTTTAEIGGTGGTHYDWSCKPGDFLIGFNYSAGKALNNIDPVCHAQRNGKWTSDKEYHLLQVLGGADAKNINNGVFVSFTGYAVPRCTQDHFVTAIHVWWDPHGDVHHIEVFCHDSNHGSEQTFLTGTLGGEPNQDHSSACPAEFFAIGVVGAASDLVIRMGLRCQRF